jgi:hypothetical protein
MLIKPRNKLAEVPGNRAIQPGISAHPLFITIIEFALAGLQSVLDVLGGDDDESASDEVESTTMPAPEERHPPDSGGQTR